MACFIAPAAEAVVTTIVKRTADKKAENEKSEIKNPFLKRMNWLNNMLWGGSALLAFEHIWHGEVSPAFPFLTGGAGALREIATSGVLMAALVTLVWACAAAFADAAEKRSAAGRA